MKLAILNTFDNQGGAAIATYRLHRGLLSIGVNSHMIVQNKSTDDHTVIGPLSRRQKLAALFRSQFDWLTLKLYREHAENLFSSALVPDRVAGGLTVLNPDIVHLFWVNGGFLGIDSLTHFSRPIVWTLHDMWPFTGGCHYDDECRRFQQSCGKCPALHSQSDRDLSRRIWNRKKQSWGDVPITVVATSHWMADMARSSSLFRNQRIEVIPNGIDTDKYKSLDKKLARLSYGLPQDKRLILFSAFKGTSDKRKGNQFLVQALKKMAQAGWDKQAELIMIGASEPENAPDLGMKIHYMGTLRDEISQVLLYSAADVTVAPSMQENLSNTVLESLTCGTPVVAFNIGGMPDMIEHQDNGYLAKPFEPDALANGIMWVLENAQRHTKLSQRARQLAEQRYALKTVARQYLELYQDLVK